MELRYIAGNSHCMIGREHNSAFMSGLVGGAINWATDFQAGISQLRVRFHTRRSTRGKIVNREFSGSFQRFHVSALNSCVPG